MRACGLGARGGCLLAPEELAQAVMHPVGEDGRRGDARHDDRFVAVNVRLVGIGAGLRARRVCGGRPAGGGWLHGAHCTPASSSTIASTNSVTALASSRSL